MSHLAPLALPTVKPRNPFAPAARRRTAGRHGTGAGAMRRRCSATCSANSTD